MVCLRDSTISNGSLATGATYFGVIESTKKWMDKSYPNASGHWAHFISGALGDTLGSVIYVPCEVMKQRMQVQGSNKYWTSVVAREGSRAKHGTHIYGYYSGMFQAGCSIWEEQGLKGLYAGYWSTLARDVPFAGLMVTFYEAFKNVTQYGNHNLFPNSNFRISSFFEGLLLGGLAGGLSAYLTTPLDVIKTRLQVQGTATRYNGWLDALCKVWYTGGIKGMFSGGVPRLMWIWLSLSLKNARLTGNPWLIPVWEALNLLKTGNLPPPTGSLSLWMLLLIRDVLLQAWCLETAMVLSCMLLLINTTAWIQSQLRVWPF